MSFDSGVAELTSFGELARLGVEHLKITSDNFNGHEYCMH